MLPSTTYIAKISIQENLFTVITNCNWPLKISLFVGLEGDAGESFFFFLRNKLTDEAFA